MPNPLIRVAPNGARRTKLDHPEIPMTPSEIVSTARACVLAGADALHLHVRDESGAHSLDVGRYRETLTELSVNLPELPVQVTTEAAGVFDVATQLECLQQLEPKWASISVYEINRDPDLAASVYAACDAQGTQVQHILYGKEDIDLFHNWLANGTIKPDQNSVLLVLGRYTKSQESDPASIAPMLASLERVSRWMVCAFGANEHACLLAAAHLGADVRVGFENSLVNRDGLTHLDNAASVAALRRALHH